MNPFSSVASGLQSAQGQELAVQVLSKQEPISHLAAQEGVSRKFLYQQLSDKFLPVKEAVESAMKSTPRASSLVENLNSRLRNYFFGEIAPKF